MTGEYATVVLHFYKAGIFAECEELDSGEFIPKGDGKALMKFLNDVDDCTDPEAKYVLTEKGMRMAEQLKKKNHE